MSSAKGIDIENCTYYFFHYMISIKKILIQKNEGKQKVLQNCSSVYPFTFMITRYKVLHYLMSHNQCSK